MDKRPRLIPEVAHARRYLLQGLEQAGIGASDRVILAISGGSDSLAVALAMSFIGPKHEIAARVVVIDHGLQSNSQEVAQEAVDACRRLGMDDCKVVKIQVRKSPDGIEAAARDARYEALERERQEFGAKAIILGHTQDDQAETVMLGLIRGSGLASISGMEVWDPERFLLRPFLSLTKRELRDSLAVYSIPFWEDPHNQNLQFKRVAVRKALEELEHKLGPGLSKALSQTAALARQAHDFLEQEAQELLIRAKVSETEYSVSIFGSAHEALRNKAIHLLCQRFGARNLSMDQVALVANLVINWHGQKKAALSGITVERVGDLLVLNRNAK